MRAKECERYTQAAQQSGLFTIEGKVYRNIDHKSRQIVCVMSKPYCEIFSCISCDSYNNLMRLVLLLIILPVDHLPERLREVMSLSHRHAASR